MIKTRKLCILTWFRCKGSQWAPAGNWANSDADFNNFIHEKGEILQIFPWYEYFFILLRHMSMTANQILEQLRSAFDCDERLWHPTYLKVYWCLNVYLFFLALNHLKQHRFNVLIAVKCLKTFYDHLILHLPVIRTRKLRFWWRKLLRIRHVIRVRHHGQGLGLPVQWHARLHPGCFAGPLW